MTGSRSIPLCAVGLLALLQTVGAQNAPATKPLPPGDWPMYRRDAAGTGHSPLSQIAAANVSTLARSWTYRLQTEGAANVNSQATPIVIGGVMYVPAGDRVVALDAATGTEKWRYVVTGGAPSRRGVGYWPAHHLHRRTPLDCHRRGHRHAVEWIRHQRRSRSWHSV
jgi:quinoprotein glucose dehydrogenase